MKSTECAQYLLAEEGLKQLNAIYGADAKSQAQRFVRLAEKHRELFGEKGNLAFCSAPGRTEIAGNHTDHNHGRVLAAAINLDSLAAVSPNGSNAVTLYSEGYPKPFTVDLNDLNPAPAEAGTTAALIRGVAARMRALGHTIGGFDACVTSTVFSGSGLSSSAAFEVLIAEIFDALWNGEKLDFVQRAQIAQYAENNYFLKPCGLMDQMASSSGGLVAIDFQDVKNPAVRRLSYDFEKKGIALMVVSVGGDHGNLTDQYAAIPEEMKSVARFFGKETLREVDEAAFENELPRLKGKVSDRALLRALHFFGEDRRVSELVTALERDQLSAFLKGIIASGESSWKLLQNLYVPGSGNQEMCLALEMSERLLSDGGAWRIHGGGFAGTILAFVPFDRLECYVAQMNRMFGAGASTRLSVRPVGPAFIA